MTPKAETDIARRNRLFAEAEALDARGDFLGSARRLERANALSPGWPEGLLNLGVAYTRLGDPARAEATIRRAWSLRPGDPTIAFNLAVVLLKANQYREGLALLEARSLLPGVAQPKPQLPFPEWTGEDLRGRRLLIWPDQGFGDQIMYARFVPDLLACGAEVTLLCAPGLVRLFDKSLGVQTIAASGAVAFPDPDYWVLGLSLPHRLDVTAETLSPAPYLLTERDQATSTGRIGFVSKGDSRHPNDRNRSLPSDVAERLRRVLGNPESLQPEDTGAKDFADTAEVIADLDLVVTVDTSVAHLAGAMGKPVWILLPHFGEDWRWIRGRDDSPWYPTARLFRQPRPGDWDAVLEDVAAALVGR